MGFVKNILDRAKERKEKLREAEDNDRVFNSLEQKKLPHNERELMKVLEEERQELIKQALYWENKKRQMLDRKKSGDAMKFNPEIFHNDVITNQKNIFLNGGNW